MTKVAICFWGISRSLKYTLASIKNNIYSVLSKNGIEYKVFIHTYKINDLYNNIRTKEKNIVLDNNEYKLLEPNYELVDDEDKIKAEINVKSYRTHPDPWHSNYNTVDNFILAIYSKTQLCIMVKNSGILFDYILFVRPDQLYISPFDINYFNKINNETICMPNFNIFSGVNDRFSICNYKNYTIYGDLFKFLFNYSKIKPLHAETFLNYFLKKNNIKYVFIPFYFNRIRADGTKIKETHAFN